MSSKTPALLAAIGMLCLPLEGHAAAKLSSVTRSQIVMSQIVAVAKQQGHAKSQIDKLVGAIVGREHSPDVLYYLALNNFSYMSPGAPEDEYIDQYFDAGWTASVKALGTVGGCDALSKIHLLKYQTTYDGANVELINSAESAAKKGCRQ